MNQLFINVQKTQYEKQKNHLKVKERKGKYKEKKKNLTKSIKIINTFEIKYNNILIIY